MSIDTWAKREVGLAKNGLRKVDSDDASTHYMFGCLDSALKAFISLSEDGHSGASIEQTFLILGRLIHGLPLTPIEEDTSWVKSYVNDSGTTTYQCTRMSSLFKDVGKDGSTTYNDVNRVRCVNRDDPTSPSWYNGFVSKFVNSIHPIKFPYYPSSDPIIVSVSEHTTSLKEDFDTMCIDSLKLPGGKKQEVKRFFKEDISGSSWIEIDEKEYLSRLEVEKTLSK